ncbi:MAG: tetratricopeptide repeat protein [Candidatus Sumerlaeota bacterium]|nr:tetratricopeptide repeat protein [Candidatus Sumerlaeota bacterium]
MSSDSQNSLPLSRSILALNIIAYGYLAFIIFSFTPWTNNLDEIKVAALFVGGPILLCLYLFFAARGELRLFPKVPLAFLVGYTAVLLLSTLMAGKPYSWTGKIEQMKNLAFLGGFFMFFGLMRTRQDIFRSLFLWTLLAFGTAIFGLFHYVGGFELLEKLFNHNQESVMQVLLKTLSTSKGEMFSTFLGQNLFATFLIMLIPILLGYVIIEKKRNRRNFAAITIGLMMICFILTRPWDIYFKGFMRRSILWKGAGEMFLHGPGGDRWYEVENPPLNMRSIIVGCGPASYRIIFPRYRSPDYHRYDISHLSLSSFNRYLDLLPETGVVGFACYMGFLCAFFASGLRILRKTNEREKRIIILGILCGMLGVCLADIFRSSSRWDSFAVNFWVMLGIGFGVFETMREEMRPAVPPNRIVRNLGILCLAVVLLAFFSGIYGVRYLISAIYNNKGLMEAGRGENEMSRIEHELAKQGMNQKAKEYFLSAIADYKQALRYNPTFITSYYKMAHAYGSIGDDETALKTYQELQKYSPDYSQVHFNLGIEHWTLAHNAKDRTVAGKLGEEALRELKIAAHMSSEESVQDVYHKCMEASKQFQGK